MIKQTFPGNHGFTLIELLIVMTILSLLLTILIPVAGIGLDAASNAKCRANLKTQANVFFAFTTDREGLLLAYNDGHGPYMTHLQTWLEQDKSLFCPEAPRVDGRNGWGGRNYAWKFGSTYSSYCFNGWLHQRKTQDAPGRDIQAWPYLKWEWHWGDHLGQVETPDQTPLFFDGYWIDTWPIKSQAPPASGKESENRTGNHGKFLHRGVTDRHQVDRQNMSFADGHVASVLFVDMPNLIWSREYLVP